jgi:serine phosphatase RsbU (regulator of sigma subunit)
VLGANDKTLRELKPDKQPVGFHHNPVPFTSNMLHLQKGDSIYTFSDGYADQFGGEKGKKFKYRQLEELLISSNKDFASQRTLLDETFEKWKGQLEQVDDILLIGVRL